MVLDGMVPVLTHTPPTTDRASTTATRFFIFEAATAARCPDGPEPMTIRSYLAALMRVSPGIDRRGEVYQLTGRQVQHRSGTMGRERLANRERRSDWIVSTSSRFHQCEAPVLRGYS